MLLGKCLFNKISIKPILILPKIAVFDLDHTVWNFGIDGYQLIPPYYIDKQTGKLLDQCSQEITHFPDIPTIFNYCKSQSIDIGLASRTKWPNGAKDVLNLLQLKPYVKYMEIYPGQKMKHFERIKEESGVDFGDMIFFDDELRNIEDVSKMGVHSVLVDHDKGVTEEVFHAELDKFSKDKANSSN